MSRDVWLHAAILLVGVFVASISQVMLKKSAMKSYSSRIKEYLNPLVILGYTLFFFTTLLSVWAYKGIPLSMGPLLESTSYLYVTLFGVTVFKEKMNAKKLLSLGLILTGIAVYALFG